MSEKKILIVVDMQNDFIDGALGTKEAQAIVPAVIARIREFRAEGGTVIATLDTHGEDYMSTPEGKKLPVPHCIKGTQGWQLRPEIMAELEGCQLVEKPTFGSVRLPGIIEELAQGTNALSIELLGLCTDICVVSNTLLLKAHYPDAAISVRRACCAGVTPQTHEAALATMGCCQIDIV
ncbi:MAG: cysteine hydrolase [Clostridia bacterium]|nr:cysteine hydrolase [Clostridia bacterium]